MRTEPKIKDCFFLGKSGECCSPEIWRKLPNMETGKPCPFSVDFSIFYSQSEYNKNPDMGRTRCSEYIEKITVASK